VYVCMRLHEDNADKLLNSGHINGQWAFPSREALDHYALFF